jgi:hypothetical protein
VAAAPLEQRRFDFYRLQRQVPAITEISYIDPTGREQVRVSRLAMDVFGSQADLSADPRFTEARARRLYRGPVYFRKESEPYMAIAIAEGAQGGVTAAETWCPRSRWARRGRPSWWTGRARSSLIPTSAWCSRRRT